MPFLLVRGRNRSVALLLHTKALPLTRRRVLWCSACMAHLSRARKRACHCPPVFCPAGHIEQEYNLRFYLQHFEGVSCPKSRRYRRFFGARRVGRGRRANVSLPNGYAGRMQTLVEWEASLNELQLGQQATALREWLSQTDERIKERLVPLLTPSADELAQEAAVAAAEAEEEAREAAAAAAEAATAEPSEEEEGEEESDDDEGEEEERRRPRAS